MLIAQGQTAATLTIPVPASAFGIEPSDDIQVTITPTDGTALFAPTAQMLLVNPNPEPGPPAGLAISAIANNATFAQTGNNYTLNLGTFAQGSGVVVAGLGITNTGTPGSDQLAGSFTTSGPSAFTLTGVDNFGPIASQVTDPAPAISLSTNSVGTFTETITVAASDVNNTGYSAVLPSQTITVTGTVAVLPPPAISAPSKLSAFVNIELQITPLSVTDTNAPGLPLTVTVTATGGVLHTRETGALAVAGDKTGTLTLTGLLADVNAGLAALTYTATTAGAGSISVTVTDSERASNTTAIALNTLLVPPSAPVFNAPAANTVLLNKPSGLSGLQLVDPFDEAYGNVVTLTLSSPNSVLSVKGPAGVGTVSGAGTGTVTITGTVQQINAQLADDLIADLGALNGTLLTLQTFLAGQAKHQLAYFLLTANLTGSGAGDGNLGPTNEGLVTVAGPEAKGFLMGVTAASFALNSIAAAAVGATPPSFVNLQRDLWVILADAHVVTSTGTIYDFNPVGEFILAASSQSGDTFEVQGRLQPLNGSNTASIVTQIAAQVGTDRVTFGVGRDSLVWVNGAAVALSLGTPDTLSGGALTQLSENTYQITWNTGEALTVTDFRNLPEPGRSPAG